jgi:hypothetical protein
MASKRNKFLALSFSLVLTGVGAHLALGEDAVVVSPDHYKLERERQ